MLEAFPPGYTAAPLTLSTTTARFEGAINELKAFFQQLALFKAQEDKEARFKEEKRLAETDVRRRAARVPRLPRLPGDGGGAGRQFHDGLAPRRGGWAEECATSARSDGDHCEAVRRGQISR